MALWLVASLLYGFVDIPVVDAVVFGLLFFCLAFMFFFIIVVDVVVVFVLLFSF